MIHYKKNQAPKHHFQIQSYLAFELELQCQSGLHIGTAGDDLWFSARNSVIRDGNHLPMIPGSSLRGVLRAGMAALIASFGLEDPIKDKPSNLKTGTDESQLAPEEQFAQTWQNLSLEERIFGTAGEGNQTYASRLKFSDCYVHGQAPRVEVRDGVSIDRDTRTAAGGKKFDLEVVPEGTRFRGKVRMKNPDDLEIGLLGQTLWMMDEGLLHLGGKSARGLGWMAVRTTRPDVRSAQEMLTASPKKDETWLPVGDAFEPFIKTLSDFVNVPKQEEPRV